MFKQNEKSIAQIAEHIPRACRGMPAARKPKRALRIKLRSIPMTAVILPFLTRRLHQLLTVIRGSLFFRAPLSSCARGPTNEQDTQFY